MRRLSAMRPRRPTRSELVVAAPFLLYALLRVPSFIEPHWYTDEAGYATTAKALLRGRTLYSQIWNNKPPLHLWTIAVDIWAFGTSEAALHALTLLSGLLTLGAVLYMGPAVLGRWRTLVALSLVAILIGTPLFDAELTLPESLLIAPATWAAAIVLRQLALPEGGRGLRWPVAAGLCAAAAIAYQQTAVADAAALGLILVLSPRVRWRQVAVYAATLFGFTAAWLVAAVVTAGAGKVAFALVGFYVAYTRAVLPSSSSGLALQLATLLASFALIVGGAWVARRLPAARWAPWVWAGATLLVPAAAQQPYSHFLLPSVVPVSIALASLRVPRRASVRAAVGGLALAGGVVISGLSARVAGLDWVPGLASAGLNNTRDVAMYYGGAVGVFTGSDLDAWQDQFDAHVSGDRRVARFVRSHGLAATTAVVWSADAWPYLMADLPVLMPTAPIYNDEVLLGGQGQVAAQVSDLDPDIIITSDESLQSLPEVQPLLNSRYRVVDREGIETVWLRDDSPLAGTTTP